MRDPPADARRARSPKGALALFGEKYGDEVRVVAMGGATSGMTRSGRIRSSCAAARMCAAPATSACFKIVGESSVAAGVRRIEAVTGAAAEAHLAGEEELLRQRRRRCAPARPSCRRGWRGWSTSIAGSNASWPRRAARWRPAAGRAGGGGGAGGKRIGDIAFDGRLVDDVPGRELRALADDLKQRIGSGVVAVVSRAEGKAAIVVGVTADLTGRFDAVELVRRGAEALGGKGGGGRPDMAQAGGPEAARAEAALAAVEQALKARAGEALQRCADFAPVRARAADSPLSCGKIAIAKRETAM